MTLLLGIGAPLALLVALIVVWSYRRPHRDPLPKRSPGLAKTVIDLNDLLTDEYVKREFSALVRTLTP